MPRFEDLKPRTLSARLRPLWPVIEKRLADGIQHAAIVEVLQQDGFDISLKTFRDYLYRQRKRQKVVPTADQRR